MDYLQIIRLLVPLIFGLVIAYVFHISPAAGAGIRARPRPRVFMIVWIVLYTLIGYSWYSVKLVPHKKVVDFCFLALNLLLGAWVVVYTRVGPRPALYLLLVILGFVGLLSKFLGHLNAHTSYVVLQPLFYWCLFALMLNFAEVNLEPKKATPAGLELPAL